MQRWLSYLERAIEENQQQAFYRNFEFANDSDNRCGTTSWKYQSMKCKARLVTADIRVASKSSRQAVV